MEVKLRVNKQTIIKKIAGVVRQKLEGESSGHDWWHIYRVWKMAQRIGKEENADMFAVELTALLHDVADWKFCKGDDKIGIKIASDWLIELKVEQKTINHVCAIMKEMSFKGAGVKAKMRTKEGMVVQDADRLDAIGSIGIARAFATGAKFNEIFYDPETPVPKYKSDREYISAKGEKGRTVINHFYEKLLLLKDRMNTETGKRLAKNRHRFMKEYLDRFFQEWEGKV